MFYVLLAEVEKQFDPSKMSLDNTVAAAVLGMCVSALVWLVKHWQTKTLPDIVKQYEARAKQEREDYICRSNEERADFISALETQRQDFIKAIQEKRDEGAQIIASLTNRFENALNRQQEACREEQKTIHDNWQRVIETYIKQR